MSNPIEMVIVRGQQKFDLYDVLNPVQIQINNGRILNTLKNTKTFTTQGNSQWHFICLSYRALNDAK